MNTLIVFSTKHGCTEKCAEILSEKLTGNVDLYNLKMVKDVEISQYDKVVIGGSIHMGKIQKEVNEFCLKNMNVLREKKIGLFICCMNRDNGELQLNSSFPQELINSSDVKESFGGAYVFKKMNPLERFIVKMVSKSDKNLPSLDMTKDVWMISNENINRFTQIMNND